MTKNVPIRELNDAECQLNHTNRETYEQKTKQYTLKNDHKPPLTPLCYSFNKIRNILYPSIPCKCKLNTKIGYKESDCEQIFSFFLLFFLSHFLC